MVLFLWESLYTNRKYLHYVVESGRALDLMVLLTYYAKESQMEGIGRVCVFCLQTLSAEPSFGQLLNRSFDAHDTLPSSIQIKNFHGKYSDYFIMVRVVGARLRDMLLTDKVCHVPLGIQSGRSELLVKLTHGDSQ